MTYKTHVVGGVLAGGIISKILGFHIEDVLIFLSMAILGSLLPDIDHPESYIGKRFKILSLPIYKIFGHRTFFHSIFTVSAITILVGLIVNSYVITLGLLVGCLSHLFLDGLTISGVPYLYPIIKKRYRLGKIRTGSLSENIFFMIILIVTAYTLKNLSII